MNKPQINFELHDATIVSVSIGPDRDVALVVDLYSSFYPGAPRVILRFGGILNCEKVSSYVRQIEEEADDDYIGCRIDCFQYDTKRKSTDTDYWFFLQTEWCGAVRIHCSEMTMTDVPKSHSEPSDVPK